eukprot:10373103-Alexandrium_andersonii.AAC.1
MPQLGAGRRAARPGRCTFRASVAAEGGRLRAGLDPWRGARLRNNIDTAARGAGRGAPRDC